MVLARAWPSMAPVCDYLFCPDDHATNHSAGGQFDEALEQVASEGGCRCPLCGAIVASDGSVLNCYRIQHGKQNMTNGEPMADSPAMPSAMSRFECCHQ